MAIRFPCHALHVYPSQYIHIQSSSSQIAHSDLEIVDPDLSIPDMSITAYPVPSSPERSVL